jgi:DEAD/DEAH box helicase domain-containing protein
MSITCATCFLKTRKAAPPEKIVQISENLGFLEERTIILDYDKSSQQYKARKTVWKKSSTSNAPGIYCGICQSEIVIVEDDAAARDFIKSHDLIDIRRKFVDSGEFRLKSLEADLSKRLDENEYKTHVQQPSPGEFAAFPKKLSDGLVALVKEKFPHVKMLYRHQSEAIDAILDNRDVVIATSTASGKSMIYNLPIINELLRNPKARCVYISPTKALCIDQIRTIKKFSKSNVAIAGQQSLFDLVLDEKHFVYDEEINGNNISIVKFDSEIDQYERNKAIDKGNIFYTTPDKIHSTMLQFHDHQYKDRGSRLSWSDFFKNLKYVVIDEVHAYRGVFGANVSYVIRRLRRMCELHGNTDLVFICCSATIANAKELADAMTGKDCLLINQDTAPRNLKHYILTRERNDEDGSISPVTTIAGLVTEFLSKEKSIRSITFGRTMQSVQQTQRIIESRLREQFPDENIDQIVKFFQGNLRDSERQLLINNFNNKKYHALIATIALELGMDLEDVHVVMMMGYPGSVSSFYQQAGRAGRHGEGLVLTALFDTPLENYYFNQPDYFFSKPPEKVIIPVQNPTIAKKHLLFAEWERGVNSHDTKYFPSDVVEEFIKNPEKVKDEIKELYQKSLRTSIGESLEVYYNDEVISGSIDLITAKRDIFVGAVYRQPNHDYVIESVDWKNKTAKARRHFGRIDYSTQPFFNYDISTINTLDEIEFPNFTFALERIRFKSTRIHYHKIYSNRAKEGPFSISDYAPPTEFETMAFKIRLKTEFVNSFGNIENLAEGAAGVESAMKSMFPEIVECDANDIGSMHRIQTDINEAHIYLYDNYSEGLNFTKQAYNDLHRYLGLVYGLIDNCTCQSDEGCPSCVHSFHPFSPPMPNRNHAIHILKNILDVYKA